jgi:hypothetical protein
MKTYQAESVAIAIDRFEMMGLVEINAYLNREGSLSAFVRCHLEAKDKIQATLLKLKENKTTQQV